MKDRFDLRVATASQQACDNYVAGVDLLLSANPGADERLAAAIAADPEFALAHIARARLLQLQARMPEARQAAARAQALSNRASTREARHIDTIALGRGFCSGSFSCGARAYVGISAGCSAAVSRARRFWAARLQRADRPSRGTIGAAAGIGAFLGR